MKHATTYWMTVFMGVLISVAFVVLAAGALLQGDHSSKQESQLRSAASHRITTLQDQINILQARNTELERANAVCGRN